MRVLHSVEAPLLPADTAPSPDATPVDFSAILSADINALFLIWASTLVVFLQVGFAVFEAGHVHNKNLRTVLLKNTLDNAVGCIAWLFIGYALTQSNGATGNGFVGGDWHFSLLGTTSVKHGTDLAATEVSPSLAWLLSYGYASTAVTIVSGAMAERTTLRVHVIFSAFCHVWIYPIVAYWVWGRHGWLSAHGSGSPLGVAPVDVAGSGVVHLLGGTCAIVGAWYARPRTGRFSDSEDDEDVDSAHNSGREAVAGVPAVHRVGLEDGGVGGGFTGPPRGGPLLPAHALRAAHKEARQLWLQGSSPVLITLGTFVMWFAFYGFNLGSLGILVGNEQAASRMAATTTIAASAGGISATVLQYYLDGPEISIPTVCNGAIAGLVSIAACCSLVSGWVAALCGVAAALGARYMSTLLIWARIDDPVDAGPVHFAGGIVGLLTVGVAAQRDYLRDYYHGAEPLSAGLFTGANGKLFGAQILLAVIIIAWAAVWTFALFWLYERLPGTRVRVDLVTEVYGLDVVLFEGRQHGGGGSALEILTAQRRGADGTRGARAGSSASGSGGSKRRAWRMKAKKRSASVHAGANGNGAGMASAVVRRVRSVSQRGAAAVAAAAAAARRDSSGASHCSVFDVPPPSSTSRPGAVMVEPGPNRSWPPGSDLRSEISRVFPNRHEPGQTGIFLDELRRSEMGSMERSGGNNCRQALSDAAFADEAPATNVFGEEGSSGSTTPTRRTSTNDVTISFGATDLRIAAQDSSCGSGTCRGANNAVALTAATGSATAAPGVSMDTDGTLLAATAPNDSGSASDVAERTFTGWSSGEKLASMIHTASIGSGLSSSMHDSSTARGRVCAAALLNVGPAGRASDEAGAARGTRPIQTLAARAAESAPADVRIARSSFVRSTASGTESADALLLGPPAHGSVGVSGSAATEETRHNAVDAAQQVSDTMVDVLIADRSRGAATSPKTASSSEREITFHAQALASAELASSVEPLTSPGTPSQPAPSFFKVVLRDGLTNNTSSLSSRNSATAAGTSTRHPSEDSFDLGFAQAQAQAQGSNVAASMTGDVMGRLGGVYGPGLGSDRAVVKVGGRDGASSIVVQRAFPRELQPGGGAATSVWNQKLTSLSIGVGDRESGGDMGERGARVHRRSTPPSLDLDRVDPPRSVSAQPACSPGRVRSLNGLGRMSGVHFSGAAPVRDASPSLMSTVDMLHTLAECAPRAAQLPFGHGASPTILADLGPSAVATPASTPLPFDRLRSTSVPDLVASEARGASSEVRTANSLAFPVVNHLGRPSERSRPRGH